MSSAWLAPVTSFTGEEIYEHIPGERLDSVFLTTWYEFPAVADEQFGPAYWDEVLEVRQAVDKQLEELRVAGGIGASLDAEVDLYCGQELFERLQRLEDELRFVLITSYARVHRETESPDHGHHFTLKNGDEMWVTVAPSEHAKCVRCWHHREDVGTDNAHPDLCGRCVENVEGNGETRRYA